MLYQTQQYQPQAGLPSEVAPAFITLAVPTANAASPVCKATTSTPLPSYRTDNPRIQPNSFSARCPAGVLNRPAATATGAVRQTTHFVTRTPIRLTVCPTVCSAIRCATIRPAARATMPSTARPIIYSATSTRENGHPQQPIAQLSGNNHGSDTALSIRPSKPASPERRQQTIRPRTESPARWGGPEGSRYLRLTICSNV